jgi:hypothetical protein
MRVFQTSDEDGYSLNGGRANVSQCNGGVPPDRVFGVFEGVGKDGYGS